MAHSNDFKHLLKHFTNVMQKVFKPLNKLISSISMVCFKTIFPILILPFFVIFICPIYITRLLVVSLSKIVYPDLVGILGVRDMIYGVDEINTAPKSSIVLTITFKGQLTKEMLVKCVDKCLTKRLPTNTKALMYPELKRYLVKWYGFIFWKEDKDFSAHNHVKYIKTATLAGERLDEKVLKIVENNLVQEPFPKERSPWCINILQNYQPKENFQTSDANGNNLVLGLCGESSDNEGYSVAIFKVHHSFVDGYSMNTLIMNEFLQTPPGHLSIINFPKRTFLQTWLINVLLIFKAPYDLLTDALIDVDSNPWYLTKERVTNVIKSATSHRIPTEKIKNIAKETGSSFTGVIVASIAGGIRNFMWERGEKIDSKSVFTCMAPFPVENHPETLGNYVSDCYLEFPIGIANANQRLKHVENQLYEIKYSTISLSSFFMQPVFGGLYHWMVKSLVKFAMSKSTGVFSSFPTPKAECKGPCGPVLDVYFSAGHDSPGVGIQFLALTYNKGWKLKIQADKAVLGTDAEVELLLAHILKELDYLEHNIYEGCKLDEV